MKPFTMPILGSNPRESVTWIPNEYDHEWAMRNHGQTLQRLRERHGLDWAELLYILDRRRWSTERVPDAKQRVLALLAAREQHTAEKEGA